MRKIRVWVYLPFLFVLTLLVGCAGDKLDGTWYEEINGERMELTIEGEDVILRMPYGVSSNGKVNRKEETMTFEDGKKTEEATYKLVGDKLSLTLAGTTVSLKRDDKKNKNSKEEAITSESSISSSSSSKESPKTTEKPSSSSEPQIRSGKLVIGTDMESGAYDIKPAGDDDISIKIYANEDAEKESDYKFEWLFPADEDDLEGDILKSYILRDGNILEIDGNTEFTKVQ